MTGTAAHEFEEDDDAALDSMVRADRTQRPPEPVWMKWTTQILGYMAVILFGVVSGFMLRSWQLAPVVESYQQIMEHPLDACRVLLQPYMSIAPQENGLVAPSQVPQQALPQPQQQKAPAAKGNNGK